MYIWTPAALRAPSNPPPLLEEMERQLSIYVRGMPFNDVADRIIFIVFFIACLVMSVILLLFSLIPMGDIWYQICCIFILPKNNISHFDGVWKFIWHIAYAAYALLFACPITFIGLLITKAYWMTPVYLCVSSFFITVFAAVFLFIYKRRYEKKDDGVKLDGRESVVTDAGTDSESEKEDAGTNDKPAGEAPKDTAEQIKVQQEENAIKK